ncbi:MAG: methylamine utilization protein [Dokdonella sp.]
MNLWRSSIVGLGLLLGVPAKAGEFSVLVTDSHSVPIADAVVSVRSDHDEPSSATPPATRIIDQRSESFVPYVELFRPGDQVIFHNSDRTRHHVYSFAPEKSFEFVIGSGRSAPPVTLDQVGEIAVGCNIHDRMIAHLYVSDAPHVAKSGADGRVVFDDLPAGTWSVQVWHPQLRPGRPEPPRAITLAATPANLTIPLSLLPDPRVGADDHERSQY